MGQYPSISSNRIRENDPSNPTDAVHTSISYKHNYINYKNKESSEEKHSVQTKTKVGINIKIQFIKQTIYWRWQNYQYRKECVN